MPPPSKQLLAALNELKSLVEDYDTFYDRAQMLEVAHNAGVLASVEGFDELSEMLMEAEDSYDVNEALKAWPVDLKIHMTYNKLFPPEEGYEGEEEHGFYEPGGWFFCINDEDFAEREERVGRQQALEDMTPEPAHFLRLDEAVDYVASKGALEDSGEGYFFGYRDRARLEPAARRRLLANADVLVWYTTIDPDHDYEDGSETFYSFHPEGDVFCRMDLHAELQKRGTLR